MHINVTTPREALADHHPIWILLLKADSAARGSSCYAARHESLSVTMSAFAGIGIEEAAPVDYTVTDTYELPRAQSRATPASQWHSILKCGQRHRWKVWKDYTDEIGPTAFGNLVAYRPEMRADAILNQRHAPQANPHRVVGQSK